MLLTQTKLGKEANIELQPTRIAIFAQTQVHFDSPQDQNLNACQDDMANKSLNWYSKILRQTHFWYELKSAMPVNI